MVKLRKSHSTLTVVKIKCFNHFSFTLGMEMGKVPRAHKTVILYLSANSSKQTLQTPSVCCQTFSTSEYPSAKGLITIFTG